MTESKRPLKVFLCHIIPLRDAHADRDAVKALYTRLTADGVDYYALQGTHGWTKRRFSQGRVSTGSTYQIGNWKFVRLCESLLF